MLLSRIFGREDDECREYDRELKRFEEWEKSDAGKEYTSKINERRNYLFSQKIREEKDVLNSLKNPSKLVKSLNFKIEKQEFFPGPFSFDFSFLKGNPSTNASLKYDAPLTILYGNSENNDGTRLVIPGSLPLLSGKEIEAGIFLGQEKLLKHLSSWEEEYQGKYSEWLNHVNVPLVYEERALNKREMPLFLNYEGFCFKATSMDLSDKDSYKTRKRISQGGDGFFTKEDLMNPFNVQVREKIKRSDYGWRSDILHLE